MPSRGIRASRQPRLPLLPAGNHHNNILSTLSSVNRALLVGCVRPGHPRRQGSRPSAQPQIDLRCRIRPIASHPGVYESGHRAKDEASDCKHLRHYYPGCLARAGSSRTLSTGLQLRSHNHRTVLRQMPLRRRIPLLTPSFLTSTPPVDSLTNSVPAGHVISGRGQARA